MDDEQQQQQKKSFIKIPSYQEVFESSQPEPPPSLFKPSSSFSDAFSFIKSSEFYTAPPSSSSEPQEKNSKKALPTGESPSPSTSSSFSGVQNRNAILVSHRQKGNPLLKHIRNVNWMFADMVCDYLLGQNSCALYLSLRYHLLHPDYLYYRIRELQKNFKLRVVLCHIDVEDVAKPLLEVTRTALLHDCTLLCGWSLEECGRYLETIKVYENKPADIIQERMDTDYLSRLTHALTSIRHVNKSDVVTLGSAFGSLSHVMDASMEDLARCPGIGERKVKRLFDTFHEPFRRVISSGPTIRPENATGEGAEPGTTDKSKEVEEDKAKQENVPSLTVKSALTAAFAKYSEKVRKKKGRDTPTNDDEGGQSNADSSDN